MKSQQFDIQLFQKALDNEEEKNRKLKNYMDKLLKAVSEQRTVNQQLQQQLHEYYTLIETEKQQNQQQKNQLEYIQKEKIQLQNQVLRLKDELEKEKQSKLFYLQKCEDLTNEKQFTAQRKFQSVGINNSSLFKNNSSIKERNSTASAIINDFSNDNNKQNLIIENSNMIESSELSNAINISPLKAQDNNIDLQENKSFQFTTKEIKEEVKNQNSQIQDNKKIINKKQNDNFFNADNNLIGDHLFEDFYVIGPKRKNLVNFLQND